MENPEHYSDPELVPKEKKQPETVANARDARHNTVMHPSAKVEVVLFGEEQVRDHVNDPKSREWKKAGEIPTMCCIDGREGQCGCCTPGGDIGHLYILALAVEKGQKDQLFTKAECGAMIDNYVRENKAPFYMHTSDHDLHKIEQELGVTREQILRNPGKDKDRILKALCTHVGCGHLAKILNTELDGRDKKYPDAKPELLEMLMQEFFERMWKGDKGMVLRVLEGNHEEGGIAIVRSTQESITKDTPVPLLKPLRTMKDGKTTSIFVYHPQVVDLRFQKDLEKAEAITRRKVGDPKRCLNFMRKHQDAFVMGTVGELAPKHPIYEVTYDPSKVDDPAKGVVQTFTVKTLKPKQP